METNRLTPQTLSQLLEAKEQTQREFAVAIQVSEGVVNRWINGHHKPLRPYRQAIAKHFGVKEEEIVWPS